MRLTIGVLLAALISPLAQAELIDEINDRGELRIAVLPDAAPYTFKQDEHLTGFAVELGEALAGELDLRPAFIETPAAQVLPGVQSGLYDIALEPQGTQAEAQAQVDVSQPFGEQKQVIPFQKDNPAFESAVNNALSRLEEDGRLAALESKWLKP